MPPSVSQADAPARSPRRRRAGSAGRDRPVQFAQELRVARVRAIHELDLEAPLIVAVLGIERLVRGQQQLVELHLVGVVGEQLAPVQARCRTEWIGDDPGIELRREMNAIDPEAGRRRFGGGAAAAAGGVAGAAWSRRWRRGCGRLRICGRHGGSNAGCRNPACGASQFPVLHSFFCYLSCIAIAL